MQDSALRSLYETLRYYNVLLVDNPDKIHSNPHYYIAVPLKLKNSRGWLYFNNISKGSQPLTDTLFLFNPSLLEKSTLTTEWISYKAVKKS